MTDLLGPTEEELARVREAEAKMREAEVKIEEDEVKTKEAEVKQEVNEGQVKQEKMTEEDVDEKETEDKVCDEEEYVTEEDLVNHEEEVTPSKEEPDTICQEVKTSKVDEGDSESTIKNITNEQVNNNDKETRDEAEESKISTKLYDAKLAELSLGGPPCLPSPTTTPLDKVASYLQHHRPADATPAAAGDGGALDLSANDADDMNVSVTSSHSVASRQSELSSLSGLRMRGMFGGAMGTASAPVCPFPDDWQYNTIPEVIENDEDID